MSVSCSSYLDSKFALMTLNTVINIPGKIIRIIHSLCWIHHITCRPLIPLDSVDHYKAKPCDLFINRGWGNSINVSISVCQVRRPGSSQPDPVDSERWNSIGMYQLVPPFTVDWFTEGCPCVIMST